MGKACAPQGSRLNHTYVKSKIFPEHTRANRQRLSELLLTNTIVLIERRS
jgi:hypothetical protein